MTRATYNYDNGTNGTFLTAAKDTIFKSVTPSGFTYTNTTLVAGLGVRADASAARSMVVGPTVAIGKMYVSCRITELTHDTGSTVLMQAYNGATSLAQVRIQAADGKIGIRDTTTTRATTVNSYPPNNDYRWEWMVDKAAGTQTFRIYSKWGTTPLEEISGACTLAVDTVVSMISIGALAGGTAAGTYLFDDIGWSDTDWVGAVSSPPVMGPAMTVWNGSVEKPATLTVWNGSVEKPVESSAVQL